MATEEEKQGVPGQLTDLLRRIVQADSVVPRAPSAFVGTSRFRILRHLGAGGFGVAYLVHDLVAGAQVALKTVATARPEAIYRLKREFRALADLRHENLVSFYELFAEDDGVFFTMEYVPGQPFHEYVRRGGLDEARLRSALAQLARGLSTLHAAGKLHRDVKPSNVLVTPADRVVLLDFGLATEFEESGVARTTELAGTPGFVAPEHARGAALSPASDWYGVGALLYQALTGRLPFQGSWAEVAAQAERAAPESPSVLVPTLPRDLCDLCVALLSPDPGSRPSAAEFESVVGAAPPRRDLAKDAVGPKPLFVGRERELSLLHAALDVAKAPRGITALVEGLSGMGKTTLVQRFLSEAEERERATVLRGRCYERESVPYQGIDSLVDDLCRLLRGLDVTSSSRVLPRHVGALVRLFPVFERVPSIAESPDASTSLPADAPELRKFAFAAIRELLARIADRRLLVLHIDDLQWADLDTAALLREVLRPPDAPPMLLVLSYRAEEREHSPCLQALNGADVGELARVDVGPLDGLAAEALAATLLRSVRADADPGRIAAEAGGSPLFIQEMVRFSSIAGHDNVPARPVDLASALRARIEQLPATTRKLLDVVAVASHPIPEPLARRAAGFEGVAWDAWHLLDQAHLVRFGGGRHDRLVEPYHDRVRDAALAALPPARAIACHAELARVLEEFGDADPEVLARHYEAAGAKSRAREFAVAAATQAQDALAFDRAARLFRWAVELTPAKDAARPRLLVSLAHALANAGWCLDASRAYQEAAEVAPADVRPELRRRAAEQLLLGGHINEGCELVGEDLRVAGFGIPRTARRALASLLVRRAVLALRGLSFTPRREAEVPPRELAILDHLWAANHFLGLVDVTRSSDVASRLLLSALRTGETVRIFQAMANAATHASAEAPLSRRTSALVRRVQELADEIGTPPARAWVLMVNAIRSYCSGAFAAGAVAADESDRTFRHECSGLLYGSWSARLFANCCLFYLGRWQELGRRVAAYLEEARERGNVFAMTVSRTPFGFVPLLARGEFERANAMVWDAIADWSVEGFSLQHSWFLQAQCLLDLHGGDGTAAYARVRSRWPYLAGSLVLRIPWVRTQMFHLRGCCALAAVSGAERHANRRALLRDAIRAARVVERIRLPVAAPFSALLRAGIAEREGRTEESTRLLASAALELERQQVSPYAAAARWHIGVKGRGPPVRFLEGEDVADPAGMARALVPGFS